MKASLNIGITCFPTFGGSGVIATEVGLAMAERGHRVFFIARELPVRLRRCGPNVEFHEVTEEDYPVLMQSSAYPIALASKMIDVAKRASLDVLHVHYAVPHATAAWMARSVLGKAAPRLVTTLHGTDITLVGAHPSYLPITRHSIMESDAVTTPSEFLKQATYDGLGVPRSQAIDVISNFVDTEGYRPALRDRGRIRALFSDVGDAEPVLIHVSNFRPLKRVNDVVSIMAEVCKQRPARLVMVGDGPERPAAEQRLRELGLASRVAFVGAQDSFAELLASADVFLLPSETESFGLAALEALSCGVPVVATNVGGVPELVSHNETGLLAPVGDVVTMARHALSLVESSEVWSAFSRRARAAVLERFQRAPAVDRYEAVYRRVLQA